MKFPHVNKNCLFFFEAEKPLTFSHNAVFRCDQNHYSKLNSKIMKMCEKILKRQRTNAIQIFNSNCKKA